MSGQGAGHATELGVVLVGAVLGLDDQLAVGEVGVVGALRRDGDVLDSDRDRGRLSSIPVAGLADVGAGIGSPAAIDDQIVVVSVDLER